METLPTSISEAIASFKRRLVDDLGSRVRRVVLFGSVVRDERRWDSDVDVLVLLDRAGWPEQARVSDLAADELIERGVLISPTVMSEEAFAELEARERRLALDVNREGVSV